MEGSHSEAIFESLNLNPQIFINEVLNSVDDLLDEALVFYNQQASKILKIEGTDRAQELTKGVAYLRDVIQSVLYSHLGMWEKYCLRRCFAVPEGFSLPKNKEGSVDGFVSQDELIDKELESELDTLRAKLSETRKTSAKLNQELQTLERQSVSGNNLTEIANEVLRSYDQNSADMFQEMMKFAEELSVKIEEFEERRIGKNKRRKTLSLDIEREDFPVKLGTANAGLGNVKLEDLQKFVAALNCV